MARWLDPKEYWAGTISDTAGTLFSFADSGFSSSLPTGAHSFKGIVEIAPIEGATCLFLEKAATLASSANHSGSLAEVLWGTS
tara:strand:- start:8364 stop:8612 length:249 start_codon:yes stop_codon:yes gene_type:complete